MLAHAASPLLPDAERATFQLADPALTIELVAAEPEVPSPVAMAWDADGRLFVAEMNDYPVATHGGQIRLLEDRNHDGRYETSQVFAGSIRFPASVLPWRDGVLVAAAPDILFLRDTDSDGRADQRRVLFTGFATANQQLRVNGLFWGLDNWVYGANGRSDGEISRPGRTNTISLRGHDFRFRPDTGEFEVLAGRSQFGHARDDWGNRFLSWNTIPIRHEVIPESRLTRSPNLPALESLRDLLPAGDDSRVFPLTPPPLTFNRESVSHFNALSGLTIFRGDALGPAYRGNVFVGESLRNLIHRRVLEPDGATFTARRGEVGHEFLASRDPWFHSVNFATGPDGALYIADFYRHFVEHPDFVPKEKRDGIAWRTGAEHGRIWRVRAKTANAKSSPAMPLSHARTVELVKLLEHPNAWQRDTAQRLLVERADKGAAKALKRIACNGKQPEVRAQALFVLQGLQSLDDAALRDALRDPHPRVRECALRLVGERPASSAELVNAAVKLVQDADARVRLQLALNAGALPEEPRTDLLAHLLTRQPMDDWIDRAALCSAVESPWLLLQRLLDDGDACCEAPILTRTALLRELAGLVGTATHEADQRAFLEMVCSDAQLPASTRLLLAGGFADGLARSARHFRLLAVSLSPANGGSSATERLFDRAARVAGDGAESPKTRLAAVQLLAYANWEIAGPPMLALMKSPPSDELAAAIARTLFDLQDPILAAQVFSNWNQFTVSTRRKVMALSLRSKVSATALLDALEQQRLAAVELDAGTRAVLLHSGIKTVRTRAETLLGGSVDTNRQAVLASFGTALTLTGDGRRGGAVFGKLCLQCHSMHGRGQAFGPDLAGVGSRPADALLVDILDPSRVVAPDYAGYTFHMRDGETLNGILAGETADSVTLRRASQPDERIARSQILELRASSVSLMPVGLEAGLTAQDVANLLAFLQSPEAAWLKETHCPLAPTANWRSRRPSRSNGELRWHAERDTALEGCGQSDRRGTSESTVAAALCRGSPRRLSELPRSPANS